MSIVDVRELRELNPGLCPATWFGTSAPAQVDTLLPARAEARTTDSDARARARDLDSALFLPLNFFGSGSGLGALASAA